MSTPRFILPRLALTSPLLALSLLGCGHPPVENSPQIYDLGTLEEVGSLYVGACSLKNKPPMSLKDFSTNRDVFSNGYHALANGDIVAYWGVQPTPDAETGQTTEVLAYKADVPTNGGPVLLKDMTIKTMTPEEFQAAPKPAGPTSAKVASKTS